MIATEKLQTYTDAVLRSLHAGNLVHENWAVDDLDACFTELDEVCYQLKVEVGHSSWVESLEAWLWAGQRALTVLRLMEQGLPYQHAFESMLGAKCYPQNTAGDILQPLVEYVCETVKFGYVA